MHAACLLVDQPAIELQKKDSTGLTLTQRDTDESGVSGEETRETLSR